MSFMQALLNQAKRTLKFVWRHFFTLVNFGIGFSVFLEGHINWKNGFYMTVIAIFVDWAKQFIKFGRKFEVPMSMNDPYDIATPLHRRQWWNPGIMGTGIYDLNRKNPKWDR